MMKVETFKVGHKLTIRVMAQTNKTALKALLKTKKAI